MERVDVLVIGGSAAGIVAAITGKSNYPKKSFMVVRKEKHVVVPCGIPYIFGSLDSSDKNVIPDETLKKAGVLLKVGEVLSIDHAKKQCNIADDTEIGYEKLVMATGSTPVIPQWLIGAGLDNVFTIPKNKEYLDAMLKKLESCRRITVVGAGFIGVEMSDELNKKGKEVTLIELRPHILSLAFDVELAERAEALLSSRGITLKTGVGIKELRGKTSVSEVILENGDSIQVDATILAMGYAPNTKLAKDAGMPLTDKGFIKVDEYMRTDLADVFAVGDCAEKRGFSTRKHTNTMLASSACAEARIAGMNLYKLSTLKTFMGNIAIFSTAIGETAFAAAGLIESQAQKEGFDIVTGVFEGIDKHPGSLPQTNKQLVKLVVSKESGTLLGAEVVGGSSAGEIINIIGFAIQNRMTVNSILTAQIGTHPLLTAPPTAYPFIKAAEAVLKKLK